MRLERSTFTHHSPPRRSLSTGAGPVVSLIMLSAAVAGPLVLYAALLPPPLILPLFGMTALAFAVAFALLGRSGPDLGADATVTWRDVAGAFALIGFAAVLLSRPEEVLPLLGH